MIGVESYRCPNFRVDDELVVQYLNVHEYSVSAECIVSLINRMSICSVRDRLIECEWNYVRVKVWNRVENSSRRDLEPKSWRRSFDLSS